MGGGLPLDVGRKRGAQFKRLYDSMAYVACWCLNPNLFNIAAFQNQYLGNEDGQMGMLVGHAVCADF